MKVLITHELFPPDFSGGGEKIVYKLATGLKQKGVEIKVLTTGDPRIKEFEGIPTVRLPINRYLMNFAVPSVCKHAKDVDLIQANNYNACFSSYLAGKILKKPVVCLVHGVYGDKWLKMRGPIFGRLSKKIEKFQLVHDYDKFIFYSDFARDEAVKLGIPEQKTKVICLGIDQKKFYSKKKEWYVLYVGRLAKQKGLDNLIEVAKELPYVRFKIVGRGEDEERLKKISPKNVEFLGFKKGKELSDIYAHAAVFCLPSLAETFGIVQIEAMASGCAIVSTVPIDYEGFHVEYGNNEQLKNAIEYLIKNKKETLKMGRVNKKKSKKYSWDKFVDGVIEVYSEVLV